MLKNLDKREARDTGGEGKPSDDTHSSRESQHIDTGEGLTNAVEISFSSFCLI